MRHGLIVISIAIVFLLVDFLSFISCLALTIGGRSSRSSCSISLHEHVVDELSHIAKGLDLLFIFGSPIFCALLPALEDHFEIIADVTCRYILLQLSVQDLKPLLISLFLLDEDLGVRIGFYPFPWTFDFDVKIF